MSEARSVRTRLARDYFLPEAPLGFRQIPFACVFLVGLATLIVEMQVTSVPLVGAAFVVALVSTLGAALVPRRWYFPWISVLVAVLQFGALGLMEFGSGATFLFTAAAAILPAVSLAAEPRASGLLLGMFGATVIIAIPYFRHGGFRSDPINFFRVCLALIVIFAVVAVVRAYTVALRVRTQELEAAVERLRESHRRVEGLINAADDQPIIATDAEGVVTVFNRGAEHVLHYSREEAIGNMELRDLHRGPKILPPLKDLEAPTVHDLDFFTKEGERRNLRLWISRQLPVDAEEPGFVLVGTDVTEVHETMALQQQFLGMVSHELRSPISSILGFTEIMSFEPLTDSQREALDVIERNGKRLLSLVSDLLLTSQLSAGKFELSPSTQSLDELVRASLAAAAPASSATGVRLVDETLATPEVSVDGARMTQVIDNLLSNAFKFTPAEGSVTVRTRAGLDSRGRSCAVLEVADSGIGIPPDEVSRLTEQFFRASTATAGRVPGTGLGLFIVKSIVDAHDGELEVSSEVGVGTTFTIFLPVMEDGAADEATEV